MIHFNRYVCSFVQLPGVPAPASYCQAHKVHFFEPVYEGGYSMCPVGRLEYLLTQIVDTVNANGVVMVNQEHADLRKRIDELEERIKELEEADYVEFT